MKKHLFKIILSIMLFIIICQVIVMVYLLNNYVITIPEVPSLPEDSLIISEICTSNFNIIKSNNGSYLGYVEIYNNTEESVNLSQYSLIVEKDSFRFDDTELKPNESTIIWLDKNPESTTDTENQLYNEMFSGFVIKTNDEVYLSYNSNLIQKITVPDLYDNQSYSVIDNSWQYSRPSPNRTAHVSDSLENIPDAPAFSELGGVYNSDLSISILSDSSNKIYYTLDNTEPTEDSQLYSSPINISSYEDSITTIRAICVTAEGKKSLISSVSYIVGNENNDLCKDKIVITLSCNNITYGLSNEQEKESSIQISYPDGNVLNQNCGINFSNNTKDIIVRTRMFYSGSDTFYSQLFENSEKSHSFILTEKSTINREANLLATSANLFIKESKDIICFVDGVLYEVSEMRENYDEWYIEEHTDIDNSNISVISFEGNTTETGSDYDDYQSMVDFIMNHEMNEEDNYLSLLEIADINSFIDYMVFNIYLGNFNTGDTNNVALFRSKSIENKNYNDGKWHWLLCDMSDITNSLTKVIEGTEEYDSSLSNYYGYYVAYEELPQNDYEIDTFAYLIEYDYRYTKKAKHMDMKIFSRLILNDSFKEAFSERFFTFTNTIFNPDYPTSSFNEITDYYFDDTNNISFDWITFLKNRQTYIIPALIEAMRLEDEIYEITIEADENLASIYLDKIKICFVDGVWKGIFSLNQKVSLSAKSTESSKFTRWSGDLETKYNELITIIDSDLYITAEYNN